MIVTDVLAPNWHQAISNDHNDSMMPCVVDIKPTTYIYIYIYKYIPDKIAAISQTTFSNAFS